ncbi:hypothetical protein ABH908_000209 [Pseudomonas frederiksbergensis]|uniref:hypothetical protein n=1 Tax=Pseudomonas TaxID=286 RepID=UPI003D1AE79E
MKLKGVIALVLVSGFAQGAQRIDIPVEVTTVKIDQPTPERWEEFQGVHQDKAAGLIADGQNAGGACHELSAKGTVVCYFPPNVPRTVGIDWEKVKEAGL